MIKLENRNQLRNIFLVDIFWYLIEYGCYKIITKHKILKIVNTINSGVYKNVYKPRADDFIFNFLGILLYLKSKKSIL